MVTFLSTSYHDHTSTLWLLLFRNTCCFYATQCVMQTSCQCMTATWLHQVVASTQHLWFTRNTLCCDVWCCFDATGRGGGVGVQGQTTPRVLLRLAPQTIFFLTKISPSSHLVSSGSSASSGSSINNFYFFINTLTSV
jgi:hypothetical protein